MMLFFLLTALTTSNIALADILVQPGQVQQAQNQPAYQSPYQSPEAFSEDEYNAEVAQRLLEQQAMEYLQAYQVANEDPALAPMIGHPFIPYYHHPLLPLPKIPPKRLHAAKLGGFGVVHPSYFLGQPMMPFTVRYNRRRRSTNERSESGSNMGAVSASSSLNKEIPVVVDPEQKNSEAGSLEKRLETRQSRYDGDSFGRIIGLNPDNQDPGSYGNQPEEIHGYTVFRMPHPESKNEINKLRAIKTEEPTINENVEAKRHQVPSRIKSQFLINTPHAEMSEMARASEEPKLNSDSPPLHLSPDRNEHLSEDNNKEMAAPTVILKTRDNKETPGIVTPEDRLPEIIVSNVQQTTPKITLINQEEPVRQINQKLISDISNISTISKLPPTETMAKMRSQFKDPDPGIQARQISYPQQQQINTRKISNDITEHGSSNKGNTMYRPNENSNMSWLVPTPRQMQNPEGQRSGSLTGSENAAAQSRRSPGGSTWSENVATKGPDSNSLKYSSTSRSFPDPRPPHTSSFDGPKDLESQQVPPRQFQPENQQANRNSDVNSAGRSGTMVQSKMQPMYSYEPSARYYVPVSHSSCSSPYIMENPFYQISNDNMRMMRSSPPVMPWAKPEIYKMGESDQDAPTEYTPPNYVIITQDIDPQHPSQFKIYQPKRLMRMYPGTYIHM